MREYKVQRKVIGILEKHEVYYIRVTVASKAGVPDVIACVRGLFVGIECKGTRGRVDPLQEYNQKKIVDSGGCSFVVGPDDLAEFERDIIHLVARNLRRNL